MATSSEEQTVEASPQTTDVGESEARPHAQTAPESSGPDQTQPEQTEGKGAEAGAHATQLTVLLVVLLLIYVAPVLLAITVVITRFRLSLNSIFDATLPVTDFLVYVAENKKDIFGLIHQLIIPVVAALAAFNVEKVRHGKAASWLFVLPLIFLAAAIVISIAFRFLTDLPVTQGMAVRDYFIDLSQNLAIYVFMLVGLKFSAARS